MHPVVYEIKEALRNCYSESEAFSLAKMLLVEVFGFSTLELYGGKDREISEKGRGVLEDIMRRLQQNEPIQYIIGKETFCGLTFEVDKNVLIPRPETQELVEWIVEDYNASTGLRLLDIGTGSGCIAVVLAKFLQGAEVEAWDISEGALHVAQKNARRNDAHVVFRQLDVLKVAPESICLDVIVSNPPYITEKEMSDMEANVLEWEPASALFVPDDAPLLFYRKIAELGQTMLKQGGSLFFEINREYGRQTVQMLKELGYSRIELRKDFYGNDRMIKASK